MSSTEEITISLGDDELTVEVAFSVSGSFLPATHWEEAESPELDIESITVVCDETEGGFDEGVELAFGVLDEQEVTDLLWQEYEERARDYGYDG